MTVAESGRAGSRERSLLDRTERNAARARTLVVPQAAVSAVVVGVVLGLLVAWWLVVLAALVAGAAVAVVLPRTAAAGVGAILDSRVAPEAEFPRYHNLMEGLSIASGTTVPDLRVIDEAGLNLATYGDAENSVIVATTGLLESLDRVELEGVFSAALSRIRSADTHLGTRCALLVCGPLVRNGPVRPGRPMGLVSLLAGARAARLRAVLGPQREFLTDLAAVDMTRYPPGLGTALEKMESVGTTVNSATWGTAHLWFAEPLAPAAPGDETASRLNALFCNPTPLDQRASLMAEL